MSLASGARLGPYEIISAIGAGGMGEVYRARDTRLGRDVAIKILPDLFAADADRVARFQREAQVLASLNHPHIAQIYGVEQHAGSSALVLELVDGPTLADRIVQGPIPIEEALPIARQTAEALETAHEHGIVHRDLKPANIKLTQDGSVKVLDFGLAKALGPDHGPAKAGHYMGGGSVPLQADLSASPTITSPAMHTNAGIILGTAVYMSPEQAKGKPADKRSDIWAFGCVLYEMLTGKRAFDGEDLTDVVAAVVRGDPDWTALPADVPAHGRTFHTADDARPVWSPDSTRIAFASRRDDSSTFNLYWQRADGTGDAERLTTSKNSQWPTSFHPNGRMLAFLEAVSAGPTNLMTLAIDGDEKNGWKPGTATAFPKASYSKSSGMFSPDGRWLAYISNEGGRNDIFVQPFPGPGGKYQLSSTAADDPTWSRTAPEFFFLSTADARVMVMPYRVEGNTFVAGKPVPLNETRIAGRPRSPSRDLDLHPDGKRFVVAGTDIEAAPRLDKVVFIFNFFDELRRIAPSKPRN